VFLADFAVLEFFITFYIYMAEVGRKVGALA
jgi:hypothetical protein